jgi:hypothetical protein
MIPARIQTELNPARPLRPSIMLKAWVRPQTAKAVKATDITDQFNKKSTASKPKCLREKPVK